MDTQTAGDRLDELVLVDVRETWEWDAGRIAGSMHIPLEELPARLGDLPDDHPLLVICRSGARSGLAAEFLSARGYEAENLDGGLVEWVARGRPLDGHVV